GAEGDRVEHDALLLHPATDRFHATIHFGARCGQGRVAEVVQTPVSGEVRAAGTGAVFRPVVELVLTVREHDHDLVGPVVPVVDGMVDRRLTPEATPVGRDHTPAP